MSIISNAGVSAPLPYLNSNAATNFYWNNDSDVFHIPVDPLQGIRLKQETREHILQSPALYLQLCTIKRQIKRYFPEGIFCLEYFSDEYDGDRYIFTVYTKEPPEKAISLLNQFDDDWWLEYSAETDSPVSVDVSFL